MEHLSFWGSLPLMNSYGTIFNSIFVLLRVDFAILWRKLCIKVWFKYRVAVWLKDFCTLKLSSKISPLCSIFANIYKIKWKFIPCHTILKYCPCLSQQYNSHLKRGKSSTYSVFRLVNFCFLWSQNGSFGRSVKTK